MDIFDTTSKATSKAAKATSKQANDILSGGEKAAQEVGEKVGTTTADLAKVPADLAKLPALRDVLGEALDTGAPIERLQFNPFDKVAARGAVVMASKLMEIADRAEGDGLDVALGAIDSFGALLGEVSGLVRDLSGDLMTAASAGAAEIARGIASEVGANVLGLAGLRQHALTLFLTHYPAAHEQIELKPLYQREPNLVSRAGSKAWPEEENQLNFYREDAQLNEHHGRWHDVYPVAGRPTPPPSAGTPNATYPIVGDRNGELFAYMHLQMIARYDAERLGVGLPRVEPFGKSSDKYREAITEGYKPGDKVGKKKENGQWDLYRARPPLDASQTPVYLQDVRPASPYPESKIDDQQTFRDRLLEAARLGEYNKIDKIDGKPIYVSIDNFGDALEASIASVDFPNKKKMRVPENGRNYGDLHSAGHTHFDAFDGDQTKFSVMLDLFTTARDPIFWRWHKHVDTIIQVWRKRLGEQQPHDFTDKPTVTVRSEDIIVCGKEWFPADVDGKKLGAKAFGYSEGATENPWDTDFSSRTATVTLPVEETNDEKTVTVTTTAELLTEMRERTIHPLNPETNKPEDEIIDYLSHDDFSYFIRLQNDSKQVQTVTIRIFLAPEPWVEDNTAWIEMDRFLYQLEGSEHAVVFRPARLSAVIRKPAVGYEELEGTKPRDNAATMWCDCGWPYTLLLPRGTKEGLDFRLLVMLSGDDLAMDNTGEKCTSMSYCGLQDRKYPDKHPMGYPFDRPLPDSIDSIIDKHENWASRKIRIRCRNL